MTAVMHFFVFMCVLVFAIVAGQGFEDEVIFYYIFVCHQASVIKFFQWNNFYESLCILPWYQMNLANQKMYLMLLIGANQEVQLNLLPSVAINFRLCIKVTFPELLHKIIFIFLDVENSLQ